MRGHILGAALLLAAAPLTGQDNMPVFETSDRCMACHNGLSTPSGQDISIGFHWRASVMANSSRDPYWQAAVRREVLDHPKAAAVIQKECSTCHMPMSHYEELWSGRPPSVFAHLPFDFEKRGDRQAADGVSCSVCHQISSEKLGTRESFVGHFVIDRDPESKRSAYGPYQVDAGRTRVMHSSSNFRPTEAKHIRQSELCATCHTLYTTALSPDGQVIAELPEQVPYQEWLHSDFRERQSCQACHMPAVQEPAPMAGVLGKPREGVSRHIFPGGNFFLLRMLNRYRDELAVAALPQELDAAALRTVEQLQSETARLSIESAELRAGRLAVRISVENITGHKLPTAYPSRRAWLHVTVRDREGRLVFESGALQPDGSIQGNDNDAAPERYEPHYEEITSPGQVQIYESIMGDPAGTPTTGLLRAVRYLKDNRLLPQGFDKRTAPKDVAVHGGALEDADFASGGDRIRYSIPAGGAAGPFRIEAELWYQPISFRWASNLRAYQTEEPRRFVRYFDSMAPVSAVRLDRATADK